MNPFAVLATGVFLFGAWGTLGVSAEDKAETVRAEAEYAAGCTFVGQKDMIGLMAADLDNLSPSRATGTRYLTLTHLSSICAKDKFMEVYRQGAMKLANGLSRSSDVVPLQAIDAGRSILRININDLGWNAADWETLVAGYPYGARPISQLNAVLDTRTGTKTPFIRSDWFAFIASRPGMYEKLLKLPKTFQELATQQGVDVASNIKRFVSQRAGFQKSGVSANNRLVERHPSNHGYFWTSYDFGGNQGKKNLFEFPTGPGGSTGFTHDGGETIFSLANGFQAYFLNDAKGNAIAKGPVDIVSDPDNPRDPSVVNGISCMRCHDQGMRNVRDELRAAVINNRVHSRDVRDQVEAGHPPREKMERLVAADAGRFQGAMRRAGLDPALKLNSIEMTFALSTAYEEDVGVNQAASELGLKREQFLLLMQESDKRFKSIVRRLAQGTIPRDDFESSFKDLAKELAE
jgi:hypothetical protein